MQGNFSPEDHQFTHLYHSCNRIALDLLVKENEQALYILQYALYLTLNKMLTHSQWSLKYVDEVAMNNIGKAIEPILHCGSWTQDAEHLGFAVAVDFHPGNPVEESAVLTVLKVDKLFTVLSTGSVGKKRGDYFN
ncbi:Uncharacterised protein [Legionella lansingensis]|uniref:Uncharacterized protein n=1 Tax=Legionella lansingensis TaxID=45067 RepID=A0A0W0VQ59_9GAMM|nr:hypothetical protein [Legionella lansingensis]KTD22184.1 hypothetical protein Llan_1447 [Legionella lansingensis]SNV54780.1 Uncharacterised protein [Legionella lansingensis]